MITEPIPADSRVGFLGPSGTFCEQALLTQADLESATQVPYPTFADMLFAVAEGDLDYAFVAVENAIEGTVNVTMDTLAFDVDLLIQREVVLPIEMNLMARPGSTVAEITSIASFPHAYAQCRTWLRKNAPGATLVEAASTAAAALLASSSTTAAIGNARAAEVYGLEIIGRDIADHSENATRFALVGRSGIPKPTGHDKTSLVVFQRADTPGSLLSILQEFAARRINLSLLLSRPTKTALGDYCFLIDIDGHLADEVVADCVRSLKIKQDVKFLGSYPADGATRHADRDEATESRLAADVWLSELRAQLS